VCVAILAVGLPVRANMGHDPGNFLRLHIRANSNSSADQEIKHAVRRNIIDELTPTFAFVTSKSQAMQTLAQRLPYIEESTNKLLNTSGFNYSSKIHLRQEHFPARNYNGHNLAQGIYDALIIELGDATGDNWWCVVYPPLCFLDNNIEGERGVIYRSRIQEIIKRFF
jgi:stage II sporulation protein R